MGNYAAEVRCVVRALVNVPQEKSFRVNFVEVLKKIFHWAFLFGDLDFILI